MSFNFQGNTKISLLSSWIEKSKHMVILTGAGMSTESGIPDFRSASGWWQKTDPRFVASVEALKDHYDMFHEFYSMRIEALRNCKPNIGHEVLAKWGKKGLAESIVTQNVDGFHQLAGSENVYEIHGSINSIRCDECSKEHSIQDFLEKKACLFCRGKLRPNVVLFGEMLPEEPLNAAVDSIQNADLLIIIGTSLSIYPANQLHENSNCKRVYLNQEISKSQNRFDLEIEGKAGEVLSKVDAIISSTSL